MIHGHQFMASIISKTHLLIMEEQHVLHNIEFVDEQRESINYINKVRKSESWIFKLRLDDGDG